jgi:hypothetical protein
MTPEVNLEYIKSVYRYEYERILFGVEGLFDRRFQGPFQGSRGTFPNT